MGPTIFNASWQPSRKRSRPVGKQIDAYVKAYQTAELDEWVAPMEQLSDAKLMRIARGGCEAEATPIVQRFLAMGSR